MTARTWLYTQLTTYPDLANAIGGVDDPRVFAKKSMASAIADHPYLVYKLGNSTNVDLAEDQDINNQFIQIFVHDYTDGKTADYMQIDAVLDLVRKALKFGASKTDGVIAIEYLETSQDLNDETLNTVMKYIRFQMKTKEI